MRFDAVLEGLQALFDARVVALVAAAHRFLLGEVLSCLGERRLLGGELFLEDLALALARARAVGRRFLRELPGARALRGRRRRVWRRRRDIDLARHDLALLLFGFAPVVGVRPAAVRVAALPDFGDLLRARRRRDQR